MSKLNYRLDFYMGFGGYLIIESQSPRCCSSAEDYNDRQNYYTNIIEEKFGSLMVLLDVLLQRIQRV